MTTLILIAQTYFGAAAYEFGPYPDVSTCEKHAERHISEIMSAGNVLKVIPDCRVLYPELNKDLELSANDDSE